MEVKKELFGRIPDSSLGIQSDKDVYQYTLLNSKGMEVQILDYGATIRSILVKGKNGNRTDCVLGYDNIEGYLSSQNPYLGAVIGRVANRTENGRFTLDGNNYQLTVNNGENHLHGGKSGFDKKMWCSYVNPNKNAITLSCLSLDGEEGYPGDVLAHVTYELSENNELLINYQATTTQPTPICMTNHSYFNLSGHETAKDKLKDHKLQLNCNTYTELNSKLIATGEVKNVDGTIYDFRDPKDLYQLLQKFEPGPNGYDLNFCINRSSEKGLNFVARATSDITNITLEAYSDQPGVQLYTSNFFPDPMKQQDPLTGKLNAKYYKHGAFCLETQNYPNAINKLHFPSPVLNPGQIYKHSTIFRFITD